MPWEETENEIRHRLKEPSEFDPKTFRRKKIAAGISLILGKKVEASAKGDPMIAQAIRFDKDKFDMEAAKAWFKEHNDKMKESEIVYEEDSTELNFIESEAKESFEKNIKMHYQESEGKPSHGGIQKLLEESFGIDWSKPNGNPNDLWFKEIWDDRCLIESKDGLFSVPFSLQQDPTSKEWKVILGDKQKVKIEYVPITESVRLLESEDEEEGWVWRVCLIQTGTSKNQFHYTAEVLKEAIPLFEGVRAFASREAEHVDVPKKVVKDNVGWYEKIEYGTFSADGKLCEGLLANFNISKSEDWLRIKIKDSVERGKPDLVGFSIDADGSGPVKKVGETLVRFVESIRKVNSVDVVSFASAGGRILSLVESEQNNSQEGDLKMLEKIIKLLESMTGDAIKALPKEQVDFYLNDPDLATVRPDLVRRITEARIENESLVKIKEAEARIALTTWKLILREALLEVKEPIKKRILGRYENEPVEITILEVAIKEEQDYLASFAPANPQGPGEIKVGDEAYDKWQKAMDGLFDGSDVDKIPRFRSIKEAYGKMMNVNSWDISAGEILRESVSYQPDTIFGSPNKLRLRESLTVSSWAQILGVSITRKMQQEFQEAPNQEWRLICSDITPAADFRTQRRMRMGGFDSLPTVAEGGTYLPLTDPIDEEATYSLTKKGGLQQLTMEMIANDDVGAIRRIPIKIADAAATGLYQLVFNLLKLGFTETTTYDSRTVFESTAYSLATPGHQNCTGTTALSHAQLKVATTGMRAQPLYGQTTQVIGAKNSPKYMIVSGKNQDTAFRLCHSTNSPQAVYTSNATPEPNLFTARYAIQEIVADYWTGTYDDYWFLCADPARVPTIEVGFYNGQETPEMFVQDQPAVGSTFTADSITYKGRFIYGACILEARSFWGEAVA